MTVEIIRVNESWKKMLYEDMNGVYCQQRDNIVTFKDCGEESVKEYLGTYFMRSLVESFNVFTQMFQSEAFKTRFSRNIRVLDIGAGAGPEAIGFVKALRAAKIDYETIHFDLVDANELMKNYFDDFYELTLKKSRVNYSYHVMDLNGSKPFSKGLVELDKNLEMDYDLTMSFKFVNELYRMQNGEDNYGLMLDFALEHSADNPAILISDVCDKSPEGIFFPMIFNRETKTFLERNSQMKEVLPVSCYTNRDKCMCHEKGCFTSKRMGYIYGDGNKVFDYFSANHKMITEKKMADAILSELTIVGVKKFVISGNGNCIEGRPVFNEGPESNYPNAFEL